MCVLSYESERDGTEFVLDGVIRTAVCAFSRFHYKHLLGEVLDGLYTMLSQYRSLCDGSTYEILLEIYFGDEFLGEHRQGASRLVVRRLLGSGMVGVEMDL